MTFALIGAGCGDDGGGGSSPDASTGTTPDAAVQVDAGGDQVDSGSGSDVDGGAALTPCAEYCNAVMTNCTDSNSQYENMDACLETCETSAAWDTGVAGSEDTDTLSCRMHFAGDLAAADPEANCAFAGPSGGGKCGGFCDNYCSLIEKNCTGENQIYEDNVTCLSVCEALLPSDGTVNTKTEHSVQCRLTHAILAAKDVASCGNADLSGGDICGTWCEVFCDINGKTCTGRNNTQYVDQDACLTACANFSTDGKPGDDTGDTVQCRIHQSGAPALRDPTVACPDTAEEATGACVEVVDLPDPF